MDFLENLVASLDYMLDTKKEKAYYRWNSYKRISIIRRFGTHCDDHNKRRR